MYVISEKIELGVVDDDTAKMLLEVLDSEYGIKVDQARVKVFLEKTASSKVYLLESENMGKIVVKRSFWYDDNSFGDASNALETAYSVSEEFRKKSLKLPKVYMNKNNRYSTRKGKERIVVLEYANGKHFQASDREFAVAGKELGKLHKAGLELLKEKHGLAENIEKSIPFEKSYEESRALYYKGLREKLLSKHECKEPDVCRAFRENIDVIDEMIDILDKSGVNDEHLTRGILHNDLHTNNMLFDNDGGLTAVLDIDQLGVGPLVWDVGNTLASLISNYLKDGELDRVKSKGYIFLDAYHKEIFLPREEYRLVLASTQRWDMLRMLRSLRRHHYENDRLPGLLPKIKERLIPRIKAMPEIMSFVDGWLDEKSV